MSSKTNQITDRRAASQAVTRVANSLYKRGDQSRAQELRSIAQFLGGGEFLGGAGGVGQDRMSEGGGDFQVNLRDGGGQPQGQAFNPSQDTAQMSGPPRDGEHPGIQPFAKHSPQSQTNTNLIHTVSMTLTAPPDVTETDMLNYILGMRDKLGVDASNVQWSKKEQKIQANVG